MPSDLKANFLHLMKGGRGSRREITNSAKEESGAEMEPRRSDPAFTGPVEVRIQGQAPTRLPDF